MVYMIVVFCFIGFLIDLCPVQNGYEYFIMQRCGWSDLFSKLKGCKNSSNLFTYYT